MSQSLDVNTKASSGKTPLLAAVSHGHAPIVKLLLSYDADIEARNSEHQTSMHIAVYKGILLPYIIS